MKSYLHNCVGASSSFADLKKHLGFLEKIRSLLKLSSFSFFIALLISFSAHAQPAACGNVNCTSNDVRIVSAYISGPGNRPINCLDNPPFHNAELHLVVSSNTQRKGISITASLNADNTAHPISNCFTGLVLNSGSNNDLVYDLGITLDAVSCGENFSLTNVFISWGTGNNDFCDGSSDAKCPATPSKCRFIAGETIIVTVKLDPDFTWQAGDCSQQVGNSLALKFTPSVI